MRIAEKKWTEKKKAVLESIHEIELFENNSEAEKEKRRKKAEKDFFFFGKTYFPHYFVNKPCRMHREITEKLDKRGEIEEYIIPIAAPRGHAKSTFFSFLYILKQIIYEKENNIVIISANEDSAEELTGRIKLEIENNERLKNDFGIIPVKGGDSRFTVKDKIRVSAFGKGQNIRVSVYRQYRPSLIICDDLEKDDEVINPDRREKLNRWLYSAVLPTLDPKRGKIFVIGTILHHDSLLKKLITKYKGKIYKAIDEEGNPTWADRFSIKDLMQLKEEMGATMFSQEYMNEPLDNENARFTVKMLKTFKTIEEDTRKFRYIDPAVGKNKKSDYSAVINGEVGLKTKTIYITSVWIKKTIFQKLMDYILEDYRTKKQEKTAMEAIAFQEVGKMWLDEKSKETGLYMPVTSHIPKGSKESRIESLVPLIENGTIKFFGEVINGEFKSDISDMEVLIEQFTRYPKGANDDGPDAVAGLVDIIRDRREKLTRDNVFSFKFFGR